jgi:serine/threonine-protein kinase RsbW
MNDARDLRGDVPGVPLTDRSRPEHLPAGAVEVRLAPVPTQLPVVRTVAADLAMRADFDLDAIADLRLAVDEACATLIALAAPGEELTCAFSTDRGRITVSASVAAERGTPPDRDSFGWQVLSCLVDSATTWVSPTSVAGRFRVHVDLTKHASGAEHR